MIRFTFYLSLCTAKGIFSNAFSSGATRGIGRAIALKLAKRGATVLGTCSAAASVHKFESLKSDIIESFRDSEHKAPDFIGVPANILDPATPGYLAGLVEEHFKGELNILVNNACYDENAQHRYA
jgi:NAD(P)-dependent dehydrogenase (short-subunit alcohol dehydrogenase family)